MRKINRKLAKILGKYIDLNKVPYDADLKDFGITNETLAPAYEEMKKTFKIDITEEEIATFTSIFDIYVLVERKRLTFKKQVKSLSSEFKKFIFKGNVVDMAVGVVIGGAFGAIIKSLTNILLTVATWGVPGGIDGLVTPLGHAPEGLQTTLNAAEHAALTAEQQALYTQYGGTYVYSKLSVIDWGTFINAIISFLIIGLTLFIIVKIVKYINKKHLEFEKKFMEEYYKKHPEERPLEVKKAKAATELDYLKEMTEIMRDNNAPIPVRAKANKSAHNR